MPRRERRISPLQLGILARRMACTTLGELVEWAKTCRRKGTVTDAFDWFCGDCRSDYRAAMSEQGRCLRDRGVQRPE